MDGLRTAERVLVGLTILLVPVFIWRVALDPFDLMKGTLLWLLASSVFLIRAIRFASRPKIGASRVLQVPVLGLSVAAVICTATSTAPWSSLFGQYQRYTGLLTLLSLCVVAIVVAEQGRQTAERFVWLIAVAGLVVVIYGFVQQYDRDPLEWTATSFGKLVFSTLGNPNTASAWLSVFIPLALGVTFNFVGRSLYLYFPAAALAILSVALLPAFYSFQGQVAVVVSLPLCFLAARSHLASIFGWGSALVIGVVAAVAPQFDYSSSLLIVVITTLGPAFWIYRADFLRDKTSRETSPADRKKRVAQSSMLAVAIGTCLLVAGWGRITSGLQGGFLERGDFYRAGWRVFVEHPLVGTGLETFGNQFTRYRSESHAVNLESSRTSSVHSIFLGMFSNGGLVLGLAYLALMVCVAVGAYRLLARSRARDVLDLSIVASWLGFQIISLVSVEHVGLYTLHFTLIGLIFARLDAQETRAGKSKHSSRSRRQRRRVDVEPRVVVASAVLVAGFVVYSLLATRPIRAGHASYSGLQAYYSRGDVTFARSKVSEAVRFAPWESVYSLQLAEIEAQAGDLASAARSALQGARISRYQGGIITSAASILFDSGDSEGALTVMRKALANDPYAPSLKKNLAILSVLAAERYKNAGDIATARTLLEDGLTLDPTIEAEGLDALKDAVGL